MWLAVLRSGVHPSVVGVTLGLLVNAYAPRRRDIARVQLAGRSFLFDPTPGRAAAAQAAVTEAVSPNERLQRRIQTWGIVIGLVVGKPIGVIIGTWVALRTGLGRVPDTLRWGQLIGGAGLSGIGFTVALFVTELALEEAELISDAKIGILT